MATRRRNLKRLDSRGHSDWEDTDGLSDARSVRLMKVFAAVLVTVVVVTVVTALNMQHPETCKEPSVPKILPTNLPRYHGPPVEFPDRYTLVLNSYQRQDLMKKAIAHYAKCIDIDAIRVVWCENGMPPTRTQDEDFYSEHKEVRYDVQPNSSLNNRFAPLEGLRTESVLSIDDDIVAPCSELSRAFQEWKSHKQNLVGFYPRVHDRTANCESYRYRLGFGTLTLAGKYSIILTKAAFMHRDYLEMYTNHMAKGVHKHVDAVRSCEDIAMQFLVANATGVAPVFVHSFWVVDLGKGLSKVKGISSSLSHQQIRSACLDEFTKLYDGVMPLVTRPLNEQPRSWWLRLTPFTDGITAMFMGHF